VLLPNDTVRLVRASEFIPIICDGSAPATVPPANPEAACVKHQGPAQTRCAGRRYTDILAEPSADSSSPRDPAVQPTTEAAHPRPRPPRNEPLLTALTSVSSPLCRQQTPATNAAAILLALSAALPSTTADFLNAPRLIKVARGRPDADEWPRVHAVLRRHDTELLTWTYEEPLPTDKP
jgi:hypothetical protein